MIKLEVALGVSWCRKGFGRMTPTDFPSFLHV
jgi:hypothetical protein